MTNQLNHSSKGKAVIFSAPSGSGKTTIVRHLVQQIPNLGFSISACTRDKRGRNEVDGKDYYFLTQEEFKLHIDNGDFIEWEEVYEGDFYGTLKSEINSIWDSGRHVIFDVDVKGGLNLKEYFGDRALAIFVKAPSLEVLSERLVARDTEEKDKLSTRLFKAEFELKFEDKFDHTIVNEELSATLTEAERVVSEFLRTE